MRRFLRIIFLYPTFVLLTLVGFSCSSDTDNGPKDNQEDNYRLIISVSPINTRASQTPVEKIKSLRIIITGDNVIELNQLVDFTSIEASNFDYTVIHRTKEGLKNFYLIGNEESIGNISFTPIGDVETPTVNNLTTYLNGFKKGDSAEQLQDFLYGIYFSPTYTPTSDGNIYLPYTAYYGGETGGIMVGGDDKTLSTRMFLVPVATKFIFNFSNYRAAAVDVSQIVLSKSNQSSYLFANVGEKNMQMLLPDEDEPMYWIDWLAEVSRLSQSNQGFEPNQSFNQQYGWISDYYLPSGAPQDNVFVAETESFSVPAASISTDDSGEKIEIAGTYTVGPFYVPESKNEEPESAESTTLVQMYYLTLKLIDTASNADGPPFEGVAIANLQALFRNTYVIINVKLSQGDIGIFAQTTDWNTQSANGFVTESPDKPNLN